LATINAAFKTLDKSDPWGEADIRLAMINAAFKTLDKSDPWGEADVRLATINAAYNNLDKSILGEADVRLATINAAYNNLDKSILGEADVRLAMINAAYNNLDKSDPSMRLFTIGAGFNPLEVYLVSSLHGTRPSKQEGKTRLARSGIKAGKEQEIPQADLDWVRFRRRYQVISWTQSFEMEPMILLEKFESEAKTCPQIPTLFGLKVVI